MKTVCEEIKGNLIVGENTTYHRLLADSVIVNGNVVARFYGTIRKKLIVQKNAVAYLHGSCDGELINNGGCVYYFPTATEPGNTEQSRAGQFTGNNSAGT